MVRSTGKAGLFTIFIVFIGFFTTDVFAGRIERAFEALEVYNLHEAERLFHKTLNRHGTAAAYGMALMYQDTTLPVTDKDTAYKYILISDSLYPDTKDRRKRRYAELGVTPENIDSLKQIISSRFYREIKNSDDPEDFQQFINRHPWARECEEAVQKRNSAAFQLALDTNTYQAYARFIEKYPDAEETDMAQAKYEERFFRSETEGGTRESYRNFIKENPDSRYVRQAHEQLYRLSTRDETVESYIHYLLDYSDSPFRDRAWKRLFELEIVRFTRAELSGFKENFPNYPFQKELDEFINLSTKTFIPVAESDKYGFIDSEGNLAIEPRFTRTEPFSEGKAAVIQNGKAGFINFKGNLHVEPVYDEVYDYSGGVAVVEKNGLLGIINHYGKELLPVEYKEVGELSDNRIPVLKDSLYGYADHSGKTVIPEQFLRAYDFSNGFARVKTDSGTGLINKSGAFVIPDTFDNVFNVLHNTVRTLKNNRYGLFTVSGDTLLAPEYTMISEFSNGKALAARDDEYIYIDTNGQLLFEETFDYKPYTINYADFKNGYAKYLRKGKFGVIDSTGNRIFPAMFDEIGEFSTDLTPVRKKDKWGYADKNVKLKIRYRFDFARPFRDTLAAVRQKGLFGFINREGDVIIEPRYSEVNERTSAGYYIVTDTNGQGILKFNGTELLPTAYDKINRFNEDIVYCFIERSAGVYRISKGTFIYEEPKFRELRARQNEKSGSGSDPEDTPAGHSVREKSPEE